MSDNFKTIRREYGHWLDTLGYSDSIIYRFDLNVRDLFIHLGSLGIHHVRDITEDHIHTFFDHLRSRPNKRTKSGALGAARLNRLFMAVDKLLEFLHQMGMDSAPAPTAIRYTVDQAERLRNIIPFTISEIQQLRATIPKTYDHFDHEAREIKHEQLRLALALFYGCGLRCSEGMKLTATDIDLDNRTILVRQGKNYKDRRIPMSKGVYEEVQGYIYNFRNAQRVPHDRLFLHSSVSIANSLKTLQRATNDPAINSKRLTLHILRHSIATHLLQQGVSIDNIARFLGHSSLQSTQIYTHIVER